MSSTWDYVTTIIIYLDSYHPMTYNMPASWSFQDHCRNDIIWKAFNRTYYNLEIHKLEPSQHKHQNSNRIT